MNCSYDINLRSRLYEFCETNTLCDVVLIAGQDGTKIPAHKLILSASSEFFSRKINDLAASNEKEIFLDEIDGTTLKNLIQCCYKGMDDVNIENIEPLVQYAKYFQLNLIVEESNKKCISELSIGNCLWIKRIAKRNDMIECLSHTAKYIAQHFLEVITTKDFLSLSNDELEQLLRNDELNVNSEFEVYQALYKWYCLDRKHRMNSMNKLIKFIRMTDIPLETIEESGSFINAIDTVEINEHLNKVKEWHRLPGKRIESEVLFENINPRFSIEKLIIRMISNSTFHFYEVPMVENKPILIKSLTKTDSLFESILINDTIMFTSDKAKLKSINIITQEMRVVTDLPFSEWTCSIIGLNGFLYAISKIDGKVERYDLANSMWEPVSSTNYNYGQLLITTLHGKLYVMGHFVNSRSGLLDPILKMEVYDPRTDEWTICKETELQSIVSCASVGNNIYVVGNDQSNIFRYEISSNSWTKMNYYNGSNVIIKLLNTKGSLAALCEKKLDDKNFEYCLYRYDPDSRDESYRFTWSEKIVDVLIRNRQTLCRNK